VTICYAISAAGAVLGVGSVAVWGWQVALAAGGAFILALVILLAFLARIPMESR